MVSHDPADAFKQVWYAEERLSLVCLDVPYTQADRRRELLRQERKPRQFVSGELEFKREIAKLLGSVLGKPSACED